MDINDITMKVCDSMVNKVQIMSKGKRTLARTMANMATATSLTISQFEMASAAFDPMGRKGFMPVEESYTSILVVHLI